MDKNTTYALVGAAALLLLLKRKASAAISIQEQISSTPFIVPKGGLHPAATREVTMLPLPIEPSILPPISQAEKGKTIMETTAGKLTNITSGIEVTNILGLVFIINPTRLMGQLPLIGPATVKPFNRYTDQLYSLYDMTKGVPDITSPDLIRATEGTTFASAFTYYNNVAEIEKETLANNKKFYEEKVQRWATQGLQPKSMDKYIRLLNLVISREEYQKLNVSAKTAYIPLEEFVVPVIAPTIGDDFEVPFENGTFTGPFYLPAGQTNFTVMGKSTQFMPQDIIAFVQTSDGHMVEFGFHSVFNELKRKNREKEFEKIVNTFLNIIANSKYLAISQLSSAPAWDVFTHLGRTINHPYLIMVDRVISDNTSLGGIGTIVRTALAVFDTTQMVRSIL